MEKGPVTQNYIGYELKDVYNADETGLFFSLPHNDIVNEREFLQWWKQFQGEDNDSVRLQC
jgi:hypothetical protein